MNKWLIGILSFVIGTGMGALNISRTLEDKINENKKMSDKHFELYLMMNQWVKVKQQRKNLSSYFIKNGYNRIAIYGMSYAGETLVEEFKGTDVNVVYGIDREADIIFSDIKVVSPDEFLEAVDAVVVTSIAYFKEISCGLQEKLECPIISLEDVLYET